MFTLGSTRVTRLNTIAVNILTEDFTLHSWCVYGSEKNAIKEAAVAILYVASYDHG